MTERYDDKDAILSIIAGAVGENDYQASRHRSVPPMEVAIVAALEAAGYRIESSDREDPVER